jgi:RNA polymerase sigma-70 factor (ECF subfamily)
VVAALVGERARLVRLCARLTGNGAAAEDLAQETLVEAWRALDRLRDPDGLAPWLSAIARNVCLRWARHHGRELARHVGAGFAAEATSLALLDQLPADEEETSITLERAELAALLDRAMGLLPPDTRAALIATYIDELPRIELARKLGLSEGTLRARLHRGRLALRRVLATDLRADATALGLALPEAPQWQETRIWCPFCGRFRLRCYRDPGRGELAYRCAGDCTTADGIIMGRTSNVTDAHELTSLKSILTRELLALHARYQQSLRGTMGICGGCGQPIPVRRESLDSDLPGFTVVCAACGAQDGATLWHLALDTPAAQRFWRHHPRMRALPVCTVEIAAQSVLLTGFESLEDAARLEVMSARDSFAVLDGERVSDATDPTSRKDELPL